jgi:methyltransferase OMS1, mitochondrial
MAASDETSPRPFQNKRGSGPFLFMGVTTFLIAGYASYEIAVQRRRNHEYQKRLSKGEVMPTDNWNPTEKYNEIAGEYDAASQELLLGITLMRWWTTRQAKGKVLEVCAGTGKNVPYYDPSQVKEIHFLDQSKAMLDQCKQKWEKRGIKEIPASFIVSSIESFPIPTEKYDTIYQTQGLCSCADPVAELRKLQSLVKPNGKIILIEHGMGFYKWINNFLDTIWEDHAKKWGCITNRNIGAIIRESGLVVESKSRWHFGTTWIIIGRPAQGTLTNV